MTTAHTPTSHNPHNPAHAHAPIPTWITLTPPPLARFAGVCDDLSRTRRNAATTWGEFTIMLNSDATISTQNALKEARRTGTPNSPERHAALNAALEESRRKDAALCLFSLQDEDGRRIPNPGNVSSGPILLKRLTDGRLYARLTSMKPWNYPVSEFEGADVPDLRAQIQTYFTQLGLIKAPQSA